MRYGTIRAAVAAVLTIAASTCASRPDSVANADTVRVGVVVPREASPSGQTVGLTYLSGALVGETLVSIDANGRFHPRLVERWERSEDGRTWTFHLKPEVKFHDGTVLTSDLVVDAIRRQLADFAGASRVTRVDETTFVIEQERASSFLLDALINVAINSGPGRAGTGPFVATQTAAGDVVFRGFDAHHRGAPSVREVGLKPYEDQRNAWAALMRNEIDVLYEVSPEARDFVETETTVSVSSFIRPYTTLLGFNLGDPMFADARVRRALNLAIDRKAIIETGLRGHGEVAYDHLWPRHWAVDAARAAYAPDKAAALRLLESSGRTALRPRFEGRMPSRLAFHCIAYTPLEKMALAIQRELAALDIDMTIELLSAPDMAQRLGTGRFEAFLFELTNARMLGYTYAFWHSQSSRSVRTGYSAADGALEQVRYARSDEEMRAAVRAVQDVMKDDPPAVFIAYPEMARAVSRRFSIPQGEEDIFHAIARWTPASVGQVKKANQP